MFIEAINALKDNYIWAMIDPQKQQAVIVDPGDAKPVMQFLEKENLTLRAILITHHHWDHCNGILELKNHFDTVVYGPKNETIPHLTHAMDENNVVQLDDISLKLHTINIPGHTLGHIAYVGDNLLFCGDTLFSAGCGRVFEGTFEMMYASLQKIAALPNTTKIYCGHEYTVANLQFAKTIEPNNKDIDLQLQKAIELRKDNLPTLPSLLENEKKVNPFLRCEVSDVIQAAEKHSGKSLTNPAEVFKVLRTMKDSFVT